MARIESTILKTIGKFLPRKEYVELSGSIIPSPDRRWCGPEFKDDNFYIKSAEGEANRLINNFQCTQKSRILDVGCGQGRLAIGVLRVIGKIDYLGIDIDEKSINWCKQYIERNHPSFKFQCLNLYNERYHKEGTKIDDGFHFEIEPKSVDIAYLYSVFTHTTEEDMRVYLKEFLRVLDDDGKIFFTTFFEDEVPNISINPENYSLKCSGPLHIVRYSKNYLFSIFDEIGYSIENFSHGTEVNGQSAVYLSKKK